MKNIVTKNLIILGAIIFSFALSTNVSAYYNPYDSANWLIPAGTTQTYDYDPGTAYSAQYYGYYNPVLAANPYNNTNTSQYGYYQQQTAITTPEQPKTSIVNNYYQTAPTVKTATPTVTYVTPTNTNTYGTPVNSNTSGYNTNSAIPSGYNNTGSNTLGASAYTGFSNGYQSVNTGNGITALSLKGSGGFMPSSVWQWIFVIILILVIIIIARTLIKKPAIAQESHAVHAH